MIPAPGQSMEVRAMNAHRISRYLTSFLTLAILAFSGCNGSMGDLAGGSAMLNLGITDTPVDGATSVVVTFTGIEIQPAENDDDSGEITDGGDGGSDDMNSGGTGSDNMDMDDDNNGQTQPS